MWKNFIFEFFHNVATDVNDGPNEIMRWIVKEFSRISNGPFDLEDIIDLFNQPPIKNFLALIQPAADRLYDDIFIALKDNSNVLENILDSFEHPFFSISNRKARSVVDPDRRSDLCKYISPSTLNC